MSDRRFTFESQIPVSAEEAFAWHLREGALERLFPPWLNVEFLFPPTSPDQVGREVGFKLRWGLFTCKWVLAHKNCIPGREFSDVQIRGPFRHYLHRRRFIPRAGYIPSRCLSSQISDEIAYLLPVAFLNKRIEREFVRCFSWQHAILREDLRAIERYAKEPLKILLSGSSGFVGSRLKLFLKAAGHEVVRLVRDKKESGEDAIVWDPVRGEARKEDFENFDAVIHLAGAGISNHRWSKKVKEQLFLSRCRDTWLLSQILCRLYRPPKTFISASAMGYYGDRKEEELTEASAKGEGFLADLCEKWERATDAIANRGTRVVHARFGAVLGAKGGVLRKMIRPFLWGAGGKLGGGKQYLSWIGIDDLLGGLYHCLMKEEIEGPVNLTAPQAVSQGEFTRILAKKVGRPAFFHLPAWVLKVALGEMAQELILSSQKVKPQKLLETGYSFRYPDLKTALDFVM
jgi:uncharacterized protein (TIGR01777 family)